MGNPNLLATKSLECQFAANMSCVLSRTGRIHLEKNIRKLSNSLPKENSRVALRSERLSTSNEYINQEIELQELDNVFTTICFHNYATSSCG